MTTKNQNKFIVVGCEGYLGSFFYNFYKLLDSDTLGTSRKSTSKHPYLDLSSPSLSFLDQTSTHFTHAIICAAIPNIVKCQTCPKETFLHNVLGTLNLARDLSDRGIKPILFSSDVVFDGSHPEYHDDAIPQPLNQYGKQKALLEQLIPQVCGDNFLIIRLTKTYSTDSQDATLLHEIARKLINHEKITAAEDLIFNPICIKDVVESTSHLINVNASGLYNLCGLESTSWFDLSNRLAEALGLSKKNITPISIDDLNSDIPRAKHINLIPQKILTTFPNFSFTTLKEAIQVVSKQYDKQIAQI